MKSVRLRPAQRRGSTFAHVPALQQGDSSRAGRSRCKQIVAVGFERCCLCSVIESGFFLSWWTTAGLVGGSVRIDCSDEYSTPDEPVVAGLGRGGRSETLIVREGRFSSVSHPAGGRLSQTDVLLGCAETAYGRACQNKPRGGLSLPQDPPSSTRLELSSTTQKCQSPSACACECFVLFIEQRTRAGPAGGRDKCMVLMVHS